MERKGEFFFLIWILYYIYTISNSIVFDAGSTITIIIHFLVLSYLCYYNFIRNEYWISFNYIYLYLLYLFILIILSSTQYFASFRMLIKYAEQLLCLPIAFGLFSNKENIDKIWFTLKVMLLLFIINYFVANYFHLGGNVYVEVEGGDVGNLAAIDDLHYINAVFICMIPIFISQEYRYYLFWLFATIFAFIIVVTSIKRTSIACMFLPLIISFLYRIFFGIKYKLKERKILTPPKMLGYIVAFFFFVFLAISFKQVFEKRVEKRVDRFEAGLAKEGRTKELIYIYDDIVVKGEVSTLLFGKETFNTVGTYANGKFGKRMIHENYGIILNGTGIIGMFIYILINLYLFFLFIRYTKRVDFSSNLIARKFYVAFISLWGIYLVSSFSGNIWCVLYPSMHYTLTGLILRYFYEYGDTYC